MITDTRLFPFEVAATVDENGRVALDGVVGLEENRAALLKFLRYLGFSEIDDRIEVFLFKTLPPIVIDLRFWKSLGRVNQIPVPDIAECHNVLVRD